MVMNEKALLEWLIKNIDPSIKQAESQFSRFDAYSKNKDMYIELKCRNKHYSDLMVEKKKFDALTDLGDALYICSTPKGIFQWTLSKGMSINWVTKRMPATSHFGKREWIDKEVGFLMMHQAVILK